MTLTTVTNEAPTSLSVSGALASATIGALAGALAKAQGAMGKAQRKSDNIVYASKYADLASVIDAIGTSLSDNGLSYLQRAHSIVGHIAIETIVMHESGEFLSGGILSIPVPDNMDFQDHGKAITYVRRYGLQTAFNIATVDDDGNAAAGKNEGDVTVKAVEQKAATTTTATKSTSTPETKAASEVKQEAKPVAEVAQAKNVATTTAKIEENAIPLSEEELVIADNEAQAAIMANVELSPEIKADAIKLVSGLALCRKCKDVIRLNSLSDRARSNEFFAYESNAKEFIAAVAERVQVLVAQAA